MKKAIITISYDAEKLGAIKQYMGKKELNVRAGSAGITLKRLTKNTFQLPSGNTF